MNTDQIVKKKKSFPNIKTQLFYKHYAALLLVFKGRYYIVISVIYFLLLHSFNFLSIFLYVSFYYNYFFIFVFIRLSAAYVGNQFRFNFDTHISLATLGFFGISLSFIIILKQIAAVLVIPLKNVEADSLMSFKTAQ